LQGGGKVAGVPRVGLEVRGGGSRVRNAEVEDDPERVAPRGMGHALAQSFFNLPTWCQLHSIRVHLIVASPHNLPFTSASDSLLLQEQ
jgi:hypothetical protein